MVYKLKACQGGWSVCYYDPMIPGNPTELPPTFEDRGTAIWSMYEYAKKHKLSVRLAMKGE